jgi:hypothetical protein
MPLHFNQTWEQVSIFFIVCALIMLKSSSSEVIDADDFDWPIFDAIAKSSQVHPATSDPVPQDKLTSCQKDEHGKCKSKVPCKRFFKRNPCRVV